MVSDFIDEHNGFLSLTDEEYERAKQVNPSAKKYTHRFLEYRENKEGYWIFSNDGRADEVHNRCNGWF